MEPLCGLFDKETTPSVPLFWFRNLKHYITALFGKVKRKHEAMNTHGVQDSFWTRSGCQEQVLTPKSIILPSLSGETDLCTEYGSKF